MGIRQLVVAALIIAAPPLAFAGPGLTVPEPETLSLLAAGVLALIIARWGKRK